MADRAAEELGRIIAQKEQRIAELEAEKVRADNAEDEARLANGRNIDLEAEVARLRERLAALPEGSVHTVVTSPPYWGLRDYGVGGQIGLEEKPEAWAAGLVDVFRAVRRVLRDDGTCWANVGDSFADKQLVGQPWLLAFALRADGWYLRSEIVWHKPNPMPESVTDRPTGRPRRTRRCSCCRSGRGTSTTRMPCGRKGLRRPSPVTSTLSGSRGMMLSTTDARSRLMRLES